MFLITKLLQAARAWRRRDGNKSAKRSVVALEQLDHRRLLSVNFTGNVATDFPATESPGVVIFNASNSTTPITLPIIPAPFAGLIKTSGYAISEIRVSYDAADDTLSVGLNQPPADPSNPSSGPVIAGDADDNGNSGNVNPAVLALDPFFNEFPALEGQDIQMAAFLDLTGGGVPEVVAGFSPNQPPLPPNMSPSPSPNPQAPKPYEVAIAIPNSINPQTGIPTFSTLLSNNTGNVYLANQAAHPNLEFSITNFSQLYQEETGHPLTATSTIGIGAFGLSLHDGGISDSYFPENTFTLSQATVVPPNPPPSPPILINPHEHRIIDTHHRDLVRVYVFGTSGFPVSEINPATVELDGVHAVAVIHRKVKRDEFPFQTYVFVADQLNLPPGLTTATLTGQLKTGQTFASQKEVLNIPDSARAFGILKKKMGSLSFYKALSKIEAQNPSTVISVSNAPVVLASRNPDARGIAKVKVDYTPALAAVGQKAKTDAVKIKVRPVVAIDRSEPSQERTKISVRLRHSIEDLAS
jgi:hypothetical protein